MLRSERNVGWSPSWRKFGSLLLIAQMEIGEVPMLRSTLTACATPPALSGCVEPHVVDPQLERVGRQNGAAGADAQNAHRELLHRREIRRRHGGIDRVYHVAVVARREPVRHDARRQRRRRDHQPSRRQCTRWILFFRRDSPFESSYAAR